MSANPKALSQNIVAGKTTRSTGSVTRYTWNTLNQLIKVKTPTDTLEYSYDAFGRRISKTHNYVTQHYLYHNQNIIAILNEDKELQATIIHHPSRTDIPLSITNHQTGKTYYYHRNHQGSIIALTNEYGEIAESIIYDGDFGEEFIHIRQEITFNPYGYTGREYDMDDLYYYRARYYDPIMTLTLRDS